MSSISRLVNLAGSDPGFLYFGSSLLHGEIFNIRFTNQVRHDFQDFTSAEATQATFRKKIANKGVIMAGDMGQSIYGIQSPYKRSGINIQGHASFQKRTRYARSFALSAKTLCH